MLQISHLILHHSFAYRTGLIAWTIGLLGLRMRKVYILPDVVDTCFRRPVEMKRHNKVEMYFVFSGAHALFLFCALFESGRTQAYELRTSVIGSNVQFSYQLTRCFTVLIKNKEFFCFPIDCIH